MMGRPLFLEAYMTDEVEKRGPGRPPKTAEPAELKEGYVRARVLPLGDGKIYTGDLNQFSPDDRFPTHKRGDVLEIPLDIATAQEQAGRVEILP